MWTYDVLFDACADGRAFKCLTVVDEYTRECLAIGVTRSLPARRVVTALEQLVHRHGAPRYLRSDNGSEFIAREVRTWLAAAGIETAYIEPGKPWQNGVGERFHSRLRDECLNREWFGSVTEAAVALEDFRRIYNEHRPHSSLAYRTPAEVAHERETTWDGPGGPDGLRGFVGVT